MGYMRNKEDKRRLNKLENQNPGYMVLSHTLITDRLIRSWPYSKRGNRAKYYRTLCNKKIRKMNTDFILNRGQYKKAFDLWWTLL